MYKHFSNSHNILISGCGGGYDIFCGLDLMFNLIEQGKNVILGSYTFTEHKLLMKTGDKINKYCYKIDKNTQFDEKEYTDHIIENIEIPPDDILKQLKCTKEEYIRSNIYKNSSDLSCYFPEYKLVKSLNKRGFDVQIYCFTDCGIKYLIDSYSEVIKIHNIDTIVLIDGGTDSLMTGNEMNDGKRMIGTPFEDISSIVAVSNCHVKNKFLYCLGFNVDKFSVTDESFLNNTANLIITNDFIGAYMLSKNDKSTEKYIEVFMECNPENSIVNSHIICSIQGKFGNYCPEWLRHRLGDSKQYIHPLMGLYWIYNLDGIYKNLKYDVDKLKETVDEYEVSQLLKIYKTD